MLNRRSFLTALCALPFVGKFIPKPEPELPMAFFTEQLPLSEFKALYPTPDFQHFATAPSEITDMRCINNRLFVTCGDRAYEFFEDGTYKEI